jgi:membrane-associated protease RseP (regulator of RpoE activity)
MKLKAPFYLWFVFVFLITNLIHEGGHWLMAAALGMDPRFGLNTVRYAAGAADWQRALANAAGPLVTIVQGIMAYVVVRRRASLKAFAFLYAAAFMRMMAMLVSVMHPNDEARLSMYFGLGKWTLPILVAAGLIALAVKGSRRLGLGWKDHLLCYLVASLAVTAIVGLDRYVL